jgi:hypothetical protein
VQEVVNAIGFWGGAGLPFGTYAWVWQEKGKGTDTSDTFIGSSHGGWKFSSYWVDSSGNPLSPALMNGTAAATLQIQPMFNFNSTVNNFLLDLDSELLGVIVGVDPSAYAATNRNLIYYSLCLWLALARKLNRQNMIGM